MESTLFARLSADAPLLALVWDRIFPVMPTQDVELPFVVYSRSETEPHATLSGFASIIHYTFQIDVIAVNEDTARQVATAVNTCLKGRWTGGQVALPVGESSTQEEDFYHIEQVWSVWG